MLVYQFESSSQQLSFTLLDEYCRILTTKNKSKFVAKKPFNFEKSLNDLENLVEKMESGDLSLEDSLKHFEKGIALTRDCQTALQEAEQKVKVLLEKNGQQSLIDFDPEEELE